MNRLTVRIRIGVSNRLFLKNNPKRRWFSWIHSICGWLRTGFQRLSEHLFPTSNVEHRVCNVISLDAMTLIFNIGGQRLNFDNETTLPKMIMEREQKQWFGIWTIIFQTSISLGSMTICLGCNRGTWQIFARYSAVPYISKSRTFYECGALNLRYVFIRSLHGSIQLCFTTLHNKQNHPWHINTQIPDFSEKNQESKDRSHDFTPQTSSFHWKSTWTPTAAGGNSVSGGSCWDGPSEFRRISALRIHWTLRAVWMCIAWVWDLQSTSFEIPCFLGWWISRNQSNFVVIFLVNRKQERSVANV